MEDSQIVALYWVRFQQVLDETASRYGDYCYTIARRILSSPADAEESVNDTWLAAWNAIPPHRPQVLRTFLGKLTRRLALKRRRDRDREKRGGGELPLILSELEGCVSSQDNVEDELIAAELIQALNRFTAGLPDTERRVFLRRYWYLDSIHQISQEFHFSGSKVKSMLFRTRNKLRVYLQKEGFS